MDNLSKKQQEDLMKLLEFFHGEVNKIYGCYQEVVVLSHEKDHAGPCRGAYVMSPENPMRVWDLMNLGMLSAARWMQENTPPPNTNLN